MDVALAIEHIIPSAKYNGSLTANTQTAYDAIRWEDDRQKPSWIELETAWIEIEAAKKAENALIVAKEQAIATILPSREKVHTAINNIEDWADVKAFLIKLSDAVYWHITDRQE